MHINTPRESDIHYNAATGSFDARVTVRDTTGVYVYAVQSEAPLQVDMTMIARTLTESARRMHLAPAKGLHLRCLPAPVTRLAA